jgi:NAD(P)-dependent dehydrogenase (short-subunit alcohol dehydrogenase family)
MSHDELEGKVVIVTGAAAGIGRAAAEAFADAGLRVAAMDIEADGVMQLQERFGRDHVLGLQIDISDPASCATRSEQALAHFGALHMLVNNAALGMNAVHPRYTTTSLQIEDVPEELWRRFMMVNACGLFYMSRQAVPIFRKQGWGRIINVGTSYLTMMRPGYAPYGPSKAVLEAWSLMLARELEGSGITVNVVIPGGPADTAMVLDEEGLDRSTLIPPALMATPMLGLFTRAADGITGKRFLAVDWDPSLTDPARQKTRSIGWPELAVPLATNPAKAQR